MMTHNKELIVKLLKGIETGDPLSVSVVNEDKYIQHNPQTHEGSEGLAVLFKRLSLTSPRINIVRVFEDKEFVFAHTEYDFENRNIGFEIFRFEDDQAVEHWDNIQPRKGPNSANYSMVDGETLVTDHDQTEANRIVVHSFLNNVILPANLDLSADYININSHIEHHPYAKNYTEWLKLFFTNVKNNHRYNKCHRILADGNFVLSVCEGTVMKDSTTEIPTSFFDLFRLKAGKIVEHWDTIETIPAKEDWKNDNGKF